jgi:hypothetical protein
MLFYWFECFMNLCIRLYCMAWCLALGIGTVEKQSLAAAICFLEALSLRYKKSAIDLRFVSMYCLSQDFPHSFEAMATETMSFHTIFIILNSSWPVFCFQNSLKVENGVPSLIT